MPTVIDSLIVKLGLDASKFTEGQKKAVADFKRTKDESAVTAKELEARGKQAATFFGGLKTAAQGLFTVLAGNAIKNYAVDTANSLAATGRLSRAIGVSTEQISAFANMIERHGGTTDSAAASLNALSEAYEHYKRTGEGTDALKMFASGTNSPIEVLKKFNEFAQGKDRQFVGALGRELGLDAVAIDILARSTKYYNDELAKSVQITKDQTKNAEQLQQAWRGLWEEIDKVGKKIQNDWSPTVSNALHGIEEWVKRNETLSESIGKIGIALSLLGALKLAPWVLKLLGLGGAAAAVGAAGGLAAPIIAGGALAYGAIEGGRALLRHGERKPGAGVTSGKIGGARGAGTVSSGSGTPSLTVTPEEQLARDRARLAMLKRELERDPGNTAIRSEIATTEANIASGRPFASGDAFRKMSSPRAAVGAEKGNVTNQTTIQGDIIVNTKATDAQGIARDIGSELNLVTQSNRGLN